jgi:hypothetical protein
MTIPNAHHIPIAQIPKAIEALVTKLGGELTQRYSVLTARNRQTRRINTGQPADETTEV